MDHTNHHVNSFGSSAMFALALRYCYGHNRCSSYRWILRYKIQYNTPHLSKKQPHVQHHSRQKESNTLWGTVPVLLIGVRQFSPPLGMVNLHPLPPFALSSNEVVSIAKRKAQ